MGKRKNQKNSSKGRNNHHSRKKTNKGRKNNKSKFGNDVRNLAKNVECVPGEPSNIGQKRDTFLKLSLKESDVGITEYLNKNQGFTAVIKARFSDFHVNEIDADGKEVILTNLLVPIPDRDEEPSKDDLETSKSKLSSVLTNEIWEQIEALLNSGVDSGKVEIEATNMEKSVRTDIHKIVKETYGSSIISKTISEGDRKFIEIRRPKAKDSQQRSKWPWPGEYVYFVVHKENADTVQVASDLAYHLSLHPSKVNYAGTKDKRGKTSQLFCVKKREPSQIAIAAKRFPHFHVGNYSFKNEMLRLGHLKGNKFTIVLRHVSPNKTDLEETLSEVEKSGFINFYGLQRFGNNSEIPTYEIGIALLKEDYKKACELILKPRENDHPFLRQAREVWWNTRDAGAALEKLHRGKFIEKNLLNGLVQYGDNDYATALRKIPRNMLMLYTHAFQSLIWNKVASRRIRELGQKPIVGDLIYSENVSAEEVFQTEIADSLIENSPPEEHIEDNLDDPEEISRFKLKVRPLSQDEIDSGRYNLFDVVLPLPGYDITYPANITKTWYDEYLAEQGLTSDLLKHKVKTYSLTGAYRKLLAKAENFTWEFKHYDSPTSILVSSDYEKCRGKEVDDGESDGQFLALILNFSLPAASYATMVLREILQSDTSAANQIEINEVENKRYESEKHESNGMLNAEVDGKRKVIEENENETAKKVKTEDDK